MNAQQHDDDAQNAMESNESDKGNVLSEEESFLAGFGGIILEPEISSGADSELNQQRENAKEYIPSQRGDRKRHELPHRNAGKCSK